MTGVLYGVGVGPGDPELLTVKALRIVRECSVIGIPAKNPDECMAYHIVRQAAPDIVNKKILAVAVPMTKDIKKLEAVYERGFRAIKAQLDKGEKIAFLNIGDPSIYGTYMRLHEMARKEGYHAKMISGVPSFCAVAAALNISLGKGKEKIHILPGNYCCEDVPAYEGTKILMKSAGKTGQVKRMLADMEKEGTVEVCAVANCGKKDEKIYTNIEELEEERAGYFTTIIVKAAGTEAAN